MQKRKLFFYVILFLSLVMLFSCEGPKHFAVNVVEKYSNNPLDSVRVQIKAYRGKKEQMQYGYTGFTDKAGKFETEMMVGTGLNPAPFRFVIVFSRPGYRQKSIENQCEGVVELEPETK